MGLEDLESIDWELAGWTDPVGQLINWLWQQIQGALNTMASALQNFINTALSGINSFVNQLRGFASAVGTAFIDFVRDPIGKIQGALSYVWSITPDWIKGPINFLANLASQVGQALLDFFRDPVGALQGLASYIWSITPDWLKNVINKLGFILAQITVYLTGEFKNFMADPVGYIQRGLASLASQLKPIADQLTDAASKIMDLVKMPVDALSRGISDILSGKVFEWFSTAFANAIGGIGQAIIDSIVKPVSEFFEEHIFKPVKEWGLNIWNMIMQGAVQVGAWASQNIVNPIMQGLSWIGKQVENLISSFYTSLAGIYDFLASRSPEEALSSWPSKAAALLVPSLGAIGLLSAAQVKVAGCGLDLKPLSDFINKVLDPNLILNPVLAGIIGAGFGAMITRGLNMKYRPKYPDTQTAYRMMREGLITMDEFMKYAAYEGWSDAMAKKLVDLWDYDPSIGDLTAWANYMEIGDDIIAKVLDLYGVPDEWRTFMIDMFKLRPLRNEISSYISTLVGVRTQGYMTKEAYEAKLSEARAQKWIKEKEVELRKMQADLGFTRELLHTKVETLRYMYRKGAIDETGLENQLVALGLDPLMANAIKENEMARKGLLAA